ncbi:hypothetical protein C5Y96_01160 [Blastopirellula marina]|uniref:Uncharacterized protein n=1 Tax=Blastopirellula marina TaxID=124 RepID=A0A2S8G963_9BACT|nr:hypothetical protein C5Y96_01160 [Blastopirellula marina]RCS56138.1 hypothetical protein DTL36_01160 [Bremerella cremea]
MGRIGTFGQVVSKWEVSYFESQLLLFEDLLINANITEYDICRARSGVEGTADSRPFDRTVVSGRLPRNGIGSVGIRMLARCRVDFYRPVRYFHLGSHRPGGSRRRESVDIANLTELSAWFPDAMVRSYRVGDPPESVPGSGSMS